MKKRIASLLLVLALCMTLPPTATFAKEPQDETPATPQAETAVDGPADEKAPDAPEPEGQEEGQPAPEEEPGTEEPSGEDGPSDGEQSDVQEPEPEADESDQPSVQADAETGAAKTDEIYEISSADDLEDFCKRVNGGESSLNAVLVSDVSRSKNYSWTSIKNYTGVFDGNGHTITLRVGVKGENSALFGSIASGGTVQDLTISNSYWNGNSSESGSIAYSNAGTIQRCQALDWTGEKNIGGLVYQNESDGVVKDCRVGTLTLSKSRENLVGGIAYVNNGLIQDCYVSGRLQSTYSGPRGDLSSATAIARTNSGTVENCYYFQYDSETAVAGTPITDEAAFASGEVAYKLNGEKTEPDSVWRQNLPGNTDEVDADGLPVTDASHGRVYYDSGSYYSLVPHLHGEKELTAWQQSDSLPSGSGSYYLTDDVTLDAGQKMDKDVSLCLNGHSVTRDVTVTGSFTLTDCGSGSVTGDVTVNGGGSFTLEDCALSGSIENNGTLTVSGGTVTASEGDAVTNNGTFTMTSGAITAATGTGVANGGTLTMNGGTVTGCDKGIEGSGDITVSGKVKISGNTNGNLILPDGKTVTVGAMDSTANIGITAEKQDGLLTAGGSIRLTSGGAAYLARFFADDAALYGIFADGEDLVMRTLSEHIHCVCGHPTDSAGEGIGNHTKHEDVTFQPWTSGDSLPTAKGNYYLTQNVVLSGTTWLGGKAVQTTTLCLNGYSISMKDGGRAINVSASYDSRDSYSTTLNLTDCAAQQGSVTGGPAVTVSTYGTVNIFGGTFRGGISVDGSRKCGLYIYGGKITDSGIGVTVNDCQAYMYGGEISGNNCGVKVGSFRGTSVYGSFYMYGGKITDNHGGENAGNGGGVYISSRFTMSGGEISNNTASSNGGGIYMNAGYFTMTGGKITGNSAPKDGGGIYARTASNDKAWLTISGAEISNNHADGSGGGLYLGMYEWQSSANGGNLTLSDSSITGNTCGSEGGGVYVDAGDNSQSKSKVKVSGNVRITGNKKGEEDNNLYLPSKSDGITVVGKLGETAEIGVTTETKPSEDSGVTIAVKDSKVSEDVNIPDGVFKVDGSDGSISVDENGTVTLRPCAHSWTYTASGAVITAKCSICSASGGSVTIAAPAELTYNGAGKAAVVTASDDWQGPVVSGITVSYTKTGKFGPEKLENGALPTGADTYTASITVENADASVKDADASVAYTIAPATLTITDAEVENKTYDGTPDATVTAVTFSGLIGDDSVAYTAAGAFDSPGAGNGKTVTVTVTLDGSVKNYTLGEENTFETRSIIEKAMTGTLTVPLTIINGVNKTYEVALPDLPALEAPKEYGSRVYSLYRADLDDGGYKITAELDAGSTPKVLKLNVTATGNKHDLDLPAFRVSVATDNYYDIGIDVKPTAKDKTVPTGEPTLTPDHITYGDALGSIALSGALKDPDTGADVEGTFAWKDGTLKPKADSWNRITMAEWTFTPMGENAYQYTDTAGEINVTVNKATLTNVSVTQDGTLTYNGEAQTAAVKTAFTAADDGTTISFGYSAGPLKTGLAYHASVPAFTEAGEHTVYYDAYDVDGNHEIFEGQFTVTIEPKTVADPAITVSGAPFTYTGEEIRPTVTVKDGDTVIDPAEYTVSYSGNTNAGTATVTITDKDGGNYVVSGSTTFTIDKADYTVTAPPKANALTYNGTEQALLTAGTASGGTMQYSLAEDGEYAESIPTAVNAGAYTVWYKVAGDTNHNGTAPQSVEVTVSKAPVTVTVKDKSAYVGAAAPDLTKPELDKDYTVEGLLGGDILGGTLTLTYEPAPDMTKTGEVAIKASGAAVSDNYAIAYVDGKLTVSRRPSSGGGGGASVPAYPVNTPGKTENGTVTVTPKDAAKGDTVTVTVTPDKGYELDTITVKDANGNTLKLTDKGSGQYTFTMPGSKVTVSAEFAEAQADTAFADVSADAYYAKAVAWAVKNGITNGKGNGLFGSNDPCTRGQIVTFLWRAAGSPEPKNAASFTDVPAGAYYAKAVAWAIENGITLGTTDTTFSPDAACTRAQSVTFLYRALGKLAVSKAAFSDVPGDSYYADAVAWAVENGVTNGTTDTTFSPSNGCTRAQIVTFLYRAYQGR